MPLDTIGSTLSVFTGQNYGAKNEARIHEGRRIAMKLQLVISVVLGLVMILFGKSIAGLFLEERSEEMLRASYQYLLIASVPGALAGIMFVYQQVLRGIGKTKESMYSGFVQLGVKIVVIVIAMFMIRSPIAIWVAWPVSYALVAPSEADAPYICRSAKRLRFSKSKDGLP